MPMIVTMTTTQAGSLSVSQMSAGVAMVACPNEMALPRDRQHIAEKPAQLFGKGHGAGSLGVVGLAPAFGRPSLGLVSPHFCSRRRGVRRTRWASHRAT